MPAVMRTGVEKHMRGLLVIIALAAAGSLAGSGTALAYGCPSFIIAAGEGGLCSPGAWLEFQHEHDKDNDAFRKRHHHDFKFNKPKKVKYRPLHGGGKKKGK
jgi:hypothetical protein